MRTTVQSTAPREPWVQYCRIRQRIHLCIIRCPMVMHSRTNGTRSTSTPNTWLRWIARVICGDALQQTHVARAGNAMYLVAARVDGQKLPRRGEVTAFTICPPFSLFLFLLGWSVLLCILRGPRLFSLSGRVWVIGVQCVGTYVAFWWGSSPKTNKFDNTVFSGEANDTYFGVRFVAVVTRDGVSSNLL